MLSKSLFLFVFIFASPAKADVTCRGEVPVGQGGHSSTVALSPPPERVGASFPLFHSITEDFDASVSVEIISVEPAFEGKAVIAKYRGVDGILLFRFTRDPQGRLLLADFRGFEGDTPFGPGSIVCDAAQETDSF